MQPGHNQSSANCPGKVCQYQQLLQEIEGDPQGTIPQGTTPQGTTLQGQAAEVTSQSISPDTSVYTIIIVQTEVPVQESQNSIQKLAQLPPLPIEPDRPEAIYSKYLATKEAWLAAYPTEQPSKYHKAIGLKNWDRRYCQEQHKYMPLDRLDPKTGREINHLVFANWTIDEVQAYLDYHDRLDHIVEEQEERRGGYC